MSEKRKTLQIREKTFLPPKFNVEGTSEGNDARVHEKVRKDFNVKI